MINWTLFTQNNLLFSSHYGFWLKHSTDLAAAELVDRAINRLMLVINHWQVSWI
jgi:hypothetical protein